MTRPDTNVPLPDEGRKILWRKKGETEWKTGIVAFCWLVMDEAAINLKDSDVSLFAGIW